MNNKDSGIDKIINKLNYESNRKFVSERVWIRPSKFKSIFGFIFSLIILIILIGLFSFNVMYLLMLLINILVLGFFAINVFTKEGMGLPKTITHEITNEESVEEEIPEDDEEKESYDNSFYDQEDNEIDNIQDDNYRY